LESSLNAMSLEAESNDLAWILTKTVRNSYKLSSMGYSYTVDKPKADEVPYAKSINWKCEKLSSGPIENRCSGRGVSAGLKPPFQITRPHNHTPAPERVEVLKTRDNIKQLAMDNNDNPRTIIREAALNLSDTCISSLTRQEALRRLIIRTRNTKCGYGFTGKCLSEIDIPENLRKT
jgi:hypothetical protein